MPPVSGGADWFIIFIIMTQGLLCLNLSEFPAPRPGAAWGQSTSWCRLAGSRLYFPSVDLQLFETPEPLPVGLSTHAPIPNKGRLPT